MNKTKFMAPATLELVLKSKSKSSLLERPQKKQTNAPVNSKRLKIAPLNLSSSVKNTNASPENKKLSTTAANLQTREDLESHNSHTSLTNRTRIKGDSSFRLKKELFRTDRTSTIDFLMRKRNESVRSSEKSDPSSSRFFYKAGLKGSRDLCEVKGKFKLEKTHSERKFFLNKLRELGKGQTRNKGSLFPANADLSSQSKTNLQSMDRLSPPLRFSDSSLLSKVKLKLAYSRSIIQPVTRQQELVEPSEEDSQRAALDLQIAALDRQVANEEEFQRKKMKLIFDQESAINELKMRLLSQEKKALLGIRHMTIKQRADELKLAIAELENQSIKDSINKLLVLRKGEESKQENSAIVPPITVNKGDSFRRSSIEDKKTGKGLIISEMHSSFKTPKLKLQSLSSLDKESLFTQYKTDKLSKDQPNKRSMWGPKDANFKEKIYLKLDSYDKRNIESDKLNDSPASEQIDRDINSPSEKHHRTKRLFPQISNVIKEFTERSLKTQGISSSLASKKSKLFRFGASEGVRPDKNMQEHNDNQSAAENLQNDTEVLEAFKVNPSIVQQTIEYTYSSPKTRQPPPTSGDHKGYFKFQTALEEDNNESSDTPLFHMQREVPNLLFIQSSPSSHISKLAEQKKGISQLAREGSTLSPSKKRMEHIPSYVDVERQALVEKILLRPEAPSKPENGHELNSLKARLSQTAEKKKSIVDENHVTFNAVSSLVLDSEKVKKKKANCNSKVRSLPFIRFRNYNKKGVLPQNLNYSSSSESQIEEEIMKKVEKNSNKSEEAIRKRSLSALEQEFDNRKALNHKESLYGQYRETDSQEELLKTTKKFEAFLNQNMLRSSVDFSEASVSPIVGEIAITPVERNPSNRHPSRNTAKTGGSGKSRPANITVSSSSRKYSRYSEFQFISLEDD